MNCSNNLGKYLRSCVKASTHPPKQQLRQTALDRPTSSKDRPSAPKKLIAEEVQVGGAPAEHAEHWKAPEIKKSSLKYAAHLQEDIQHKQQKRCSETIERAYP